MPADLAVWLILISSNYPCLEHNSMVPKVFEPLKFYCIYFIRWCNSHFFLHYGFIVLFNINMSGLFHPRMCKILHLVIDYSLLCNVWCPKKGRVLYGNSTTGILRLKYNCKWATPFLYCLFSLNSSHDLQERKQEGAMCEKDKHLHLCFRQ